MRSKSLSITKPGIIFGNLVTVSGGFFLGSHGLIDAAKLLITLVGMGFVVASGCILNNFIDRDIDQLMERTKNRPLAQGLISGSRANLTAIAYSIIGLCLLWFVINPITAFIALVGLFFYVGVYTICLKRRSVHGTTIGGIAGAIPPVAGYCAAANQFDIGALLVFAILFFWQLPHFYAIAIFRLKDFDAAQIPVLPLKRGMHYTKVSMLVFIVCFAFAAVSPAYVGYAGWRYFTIALVLSAGWFYEGLKGLNTANDVRWARKMFLYSIVNITLLSLAMLVK